MNYLDSDQTVRKKVQAAEQWRRFATESITRQGEADTALSQACEAMAAFEEMATAQEETDTQAAGRSMLMAAEDEMLDHMANYLANWAAQTGQLKASVLTKFTAKYNLL